MKLNSGVDIILVIVSCQIFTSWFVGAVYGFWIKMHYLLDEITLLVTIPTEHIRAYVL